MRRKSVFKILLMLLLIGTLAMGFAVDNINDPFPHIQTIQYKVYDNTEQMNDALLIDNEIDMRPGPGIMELIDDCIAADYNMTVDPLSAFGFMALQNRDVYCAHVSGGPAGKTPGETAQPLNDSRFRVALSYIWGMDDKADAIYEYYVNYLIVALGRPIPPSQAGWYDPNCIMPNTDNATAWAILDAAGYTVGTGDDAGYLLNPDGSRVRDLEVVYPSGWLLWEHILQRFVAQVNAFFDEYVGVPNGPNFILTDREYVALLYELMVYHDFDLLAFDITRLGLTPDWCYDFYHSTTIGKRQWNFCGFQNETMDALLDTMMYSLDEATVRDAVWTMGCLFVSDWMPLFPVTTGQGITTWHPDIDNFVGSPGPGADQCLMNWRSVHWGPDTVYTNPPYEGVIRRGLEDEPDTLNPWNENTESGWLILDGLCEPLMMPSPPDPSVDMPWIAYRSEVEVVNSTVNAEASEALDIPDGMKVTYYLRNDVYWQDTGAGGKTFQFTADDCQFAFTMLKKWQVEKYHSIWENVVYAEAEERYEFDVYFNATSLWYEDYPQLASFFPKHIYYILDEMAEQASDNYDEQKLVFDAFIPDAWDYQDWTAKAKELWYTSTRPQYLDYYAAWPDAGLPPRDGNAPQTAQVGIGAFVYDYYYDDTRIGEVHSNDVYWVDGPIKAVVDAPGVILAWEEDPIEYNVIISNYGYKVDGELASKTVDVRIYEEDIVTHTETNVEVGVFDWTTLGPYSISTASGFYNITVEVLQDSTVIDKYTHISVVTIPEDVDRNCHVRVEDVLAINLARWTYPGHPRWASGSDINDDFAVNIIDESSAAKMFGWDSGDPISPPEPPEPQPYTVHVVADTRNKTVVGQERNFTLYIEIVNVTNLYCYDILLNYDTTLLELVDWELFTPNGGKWTNAAEGYVSVYDWMLVPTITGNATIAKLTFTAKERCNYTLDPSQSILGVDCRISKISFVPDIAEIMISFDGDVTKGGDGKVRIDDILAIALAFGTDSGGPPNEKGYYYEPNLDITNDLKIRVDDILAAAINFGAGP